MKIILSTKIGDRYYLNTVAFLKTPRKFKSTRVIIDTGSPSTILSYSDAMDLQVPLSNLEKGDIINIGGSKYQGYIFRKLKIRMRSEDGTDMEEDVVVNTVKPTSQKEHIELTSMPTIIGNDFLKDKKLKLFCDFANENAYLERD